jgi:hypothetical protein
VARFVVIGNGSNRRVTMFQDALVAQGHRPAIVIEWRDLAVPGAPARLLADLPREVILRIDSMGEDDEVERALLRRGAAAAQAEGSPWIDPGALARIPREVGRILCPRQAHLGFLAVLAELESAIQPTWRVPQPVPAIIELFDKRVTSARWATLGIPIPDPLVDVRDPEDLRARMREAGWPAVFVKVACSSSASCLAVFSHRRSGEYAITTVEDAGSARYNTRKLQRLSKRRDIDRLLGFLLAEGAHVERAVPKARTAGGYFDLRVLAIDGEPAFVVARVSPHPITNLHLGGVRGDVETLRARVPEPTWRAAMASARAVQRQSGAFHVGVDILLEPGLTGHRVIEGNAFGDLLPNLRRDGLDVYAWQVRRLAGARSRHESPRSRA